MRFILGSKSPRRKEILSFFSLPFIQVASDFHEESVSFEGDPALYAKTLAQKKAQALLERFPQDLILTADTVVFLKGGIFNKPEDETQAFHMLRALSGQWHQVFTGVTLCSHKGLYTQSEETKILFNTLSDEQIHHYLKHNAFLDKAGGYAIQGQGSLLVRQIEGCYYNVMGLPVNVVRELLCPLGIDLWRHLGPASS